MPPTCDDATAKEEPGANEDASNKDAFFIDSEDSLIKSVALGGVVGVSTVMVGYPLDTVKVRLQTGARPLLGNLYRGVWSPLGAVIPSYFALFFGYGVGLKMMGSNDIISVAAAGGFSGVCYSIIMCPFEMVKCNTQRSRQPLKQVFHQVLAERGALGMYRGFGACLCRDIGQGVAYYTFAEYLNQSAWVQGTFGKGAPFFSGMLVGLFHCSVELPFDTIKTRFQTGSAISYSALLRDMFSGGAASGFRNVFRGYGVWMFRAPIVHGTTFAVVQHATPFLNRWFD